MHQTWPMAPPPPTMRGCAASRYRLNDPPCHNTTCLWRFIHALADLTAAGRLLPFAVLFFRSGHEFHLQTKPYPSRPPPWFPRPHGKPPWARHLGPASRQGAQAPDTLKWSFPASLRLKSKADFAGLRQARSLTCGGLLLRYVRNNRGQARLGLAISRRYGSAVRRNRLRRQLREAFRTHPIRDEGVDILVAVTGRSKISDPAKEMQKGLNMILNRLRTSA